MWQRSLIAAMATGMIGSGAFATADLQITEMWGGGLSGTEATSDWFELTNSGTSAATGVDSLSYDDDSANPEADDAMVGISTIAPGESVIFITSWEDDWATAADAILAFTTQWGAPNGNLAGVQIGYVDGGGGLGGGGDAVFIFDGNTAGANIIDTEGYSVSTSEPTFVSAADGTWTDNTLAQDGVLGAYLSNGLASDGVTLPAIGSPGVVPEPASLALLGLGGLVMLGRRRKA